MGERSPRARQSAARPPAGRPAPSQASSAPQAGGAGPAGKERLQRALTAAAEVPQGDREGGGGRAGQAVATSPLPFQPRRGGGFTCRPSPRRPPAPARGAR